MNVRAFLSLLLLCALALVSTMARAQDLRQVVQDLRSTDKARFVLAVDNIAKSSDPAALTVLEALAKDALRIDAAGVPFVAGEGGQLTPAFAGDGKASGALYTPL